MFGFQTGRFYQLTYLKELDKVFPLKCRRLPARSLNQSFEIGNYIQIIIIYVTEQMGQDL